MASRNLRPPAVTRPPPRTRRRANEEAMSHADTTSALVGSTNVEVQPVQSVQKRRTKSDSASVTVDDRDASTSTATASNPPARGRQPFGRKVTLTDFEPQEPDLSDDMLGDGSPAIQPPAAQTERPSVAQELVPTGVRTATPSESATSAMPVLAPCPAPAHEPPPLAPRPAPAPAHEPRPAATPLAPPAADAATPLAPPAADADAPLVPPPAHAAALPASPPATTPLAPPAANVAANAAVPQSLLETAGSSDSDSEDESEGDESKTKLKKKPTKRKHKPGPLSKEEEEEFDVMAAAFLKSMERLSERTGKSMHYLVERLGWFLKEPREGTRWNYFQARWWIENDSLGEDESSTAKAERCLKDYEEESEGKTDAQKEELCQRDKAWCEAYAKETAKDAILEEGRYKAHLRLFALLQQISRPFYINYGLACFGAVICTDASDPASCSLNGMWANTERAEPWIKERGPSIKAVTNAFAHAVGGDVAEEMDRFGLDMVAAIPGMSQDRLRRWGRELSRKFQDFAFKNCVPPKPPRKHVNWGTFGDEMVEVGIRCTNWPAGCPISDNLPGNQDQFSTPVYRIITPRMLLALNDPASPDAIRFEAIPPEELAWRHDPQSREKWLGVVTWSGPGGVPLQHVKDCPEASKPPKSSKRTRVAALLDDVDTADSQPSEPAPQPLKKRARKQPSSALSAMTGPPVASSSAPAASSSAPSVPRSRAHPRVPTQRQRPQSLDSTLTAPMSKPSAPAAPKSSAPRPVTPLDDDDDMFAGEVSPPRGPECCGQPYKTYMDNPRERTIRDSLHLKTHTRRSQRRRGDREASPNLLEAFWVETCCKGDSPS
ncbi:hypothetical protein EXIGLDRAFT_774254 [Exidia glandulosa HHB12029]|uniref:Uncharacterized protein n=1 Tax=Exidia glandulosa HHB12029 TaxID=1314781 RepID=A0A165EEY3_EXIGL|nr:hypothetical protein EXIGLDRAFT_774254 [Exidia glandulosa HHB12029]